MIDLRLCVFRDIQSQVYFSLWIKYGGHWYKKCNTPIRHRPLTRYTIYVKLRIAPAPGMPGMFSPPPASKEIASQRSRHASRHVRHARAVMQIGIANPRWRGKRSRHSRRMRNPHSYLSGKRPMHALLVRSICANSRISGLIPLWIETWQNVA